MKRCHNMLFPLAATTMVVLGASCVGTESYHKSVDVPQVWTPTDTLYYDIEVDSVSPNPGYVTPHVPYHVTLEVRHTSDFIYRDMSILMALSQQDSIGQWHYIQPRWWRVTGALTDAQGFYDGDGWGSLIQKSLVLDRTISFPEVGQYRVEIMPCWDTLQVENLISLGLMLER